MPELIAKTALQDQAVISRAGLTLAPLPAGAIWSVALYPGQDEAAAAAFAPLGLRFPQPGHWHEAAGICLAWNGKDQALLFGAAPPAGLQGVAAVCDQSSGLAGFALSGTGAAEALSRLVEPDLRAHVFAPGRAARTALNHVPALILRREAGFEIYVFRSMARSVRHELAEVLERFEARAAV